MKQSKATTPKTRSGRRAKERAASDAPTRIAVGARARIAVDMERAARDARTRIAVAAQRAAVEALRDEFRGGAAECMRALKRLADVESRLAGGNPGFGWVGLDDSVLEVCNVEPCVNAAVGMQDVEEVLEWLETAIFETAENLAAAMKQAAEEAAFGVGGLAGLREGAPAARGAAR